MSSEPANLLEYQPRHRYATEKKVWRSVIFYGLGIVGLITVLAVLLIAGSFLGSSLGLW
jgi:small-conductance mechanosensitive channel